MDVSVILAYKRNHLNMNKTLVAILLSILIAAPIFSESGTHEAHHGAGEAFDLNGVIVHHLKDEVILPLPPIYGIDMSITKRVSMMWIVSLALFLVFIPAARLIAKDPLRIHGKFANAVEAMVTFLKDDVADGNIHDHAKPYYHYLFTLFFFILFCNLFGLIPSVGEFVDLALGQHDGWASKIWSGITVTGDVAVTACLALITLSMILGTGFVFQGIWFIPHAVPRGVPFYIWPILWPLEFIVSPLAKCFALTVRLLANMTAGHVIILALMGFIFQFRSYGIIPVSIVGSGAIFVLELFVAVLQAYIFTLLTTIFISSVMHRH